MRKAYGTELWNATRSYAVWLPGNAVALGDYGLLKENCFERIGKVSDLLSGYAPEISESELDELHFRSDGVSEVKTAGRAPKDLVKITYSVSSDSAVVFRAKKMAVRSIANLPVLSDALKNLKEWDRSWQVVTSVTSAKTFYVFIGGKKGSQFTVTSDLSVFPKLDVPLSAAQGSFRLEGDCALKIAGQSGPIMVNLHRMRILGSGLKYAAPSEDEVADATLMPFIDELEEP